MYKIKLHETSECPWPVYTDMFVWYVEVNVFFFDVFVNHFPKIHRSSLRKITRDLLYFWDVCEVNLCGKSFGKSTTYSCRTNVFIISLFQRKKDTPTQVFSCGICKTFKNCGGSFWKHVISLCNKKIRRA